MGLEAQASHGYVDTEPRDHRLAFEGRLDGRPIGDIALRASFRARLDTVEGDPLRSTLTGAFGLTYGHWLRPDLALGASLDASFGGSDFFDLDLGATRIAGRAGMVYRWAGSGTALGFDVGYVHDRSAHILPDGADPSPGDRVALMVDEHDALSMRLSVSHGQGLRGWAMIDASPRLGAEAPLDGSLRLLGGLLGGFRPELGWALFASVSLAAAPSVASGAPLRAVPARFGVGLGLRYDPFASRRVAATPEPEPEPGPEPEPEPEPEPVVAPPPPTRSVAGQLKDDMGYPIRGASIRYRVGETEGAIETEADGSFRLDGLPERAVTLEVSVEGFEPWVQEMAVGTDEPVEIDLVPAIPTSQLRGLIRAIHGAPLAAQVRISGVPEIIHTDEEGRFTLELPPGSYTVEILAEGYRNQRRRARVEEGGVTVLNVELRRAP